MKFLSPTCRDTDRNFKFAALADLASIATTWIDLDVLSRWILIVAIALRQIVAGTCGRLRTRDRTNGAAGDGAHSSSDRPPRDQAAQNTANDRATDGTRGGIRWGRRRGWRIGGHGRRIARARPRAGTPSALPALPITMGGRSGQPE